MPSNFNPDPKYIYPLCYDIRTWLASVISEFLLTFTNNMLTRTPCVKTPECGCCQKCPPASTCVNINTNLPCFDTGSKAAEKKCYQIGTGCPCGSQCNNENPVCWNPNSNHVDFWSNLPPDVRANDRNLTQPSCSACEAPASTPSVVTDGTSQFQGIGSQISVSFAAQVATVALTLSSGSLSSGFSDDQDTQIATLKDQLESMQKALSGFV